MQDAAFLKVFEFFNTKIVSSVWQDQYAGLLALAQSLKGPSPQLIVDNIKPMFESFLNLI
jgi:hypothetical protein